MLRHASAFLCCLTLALAAPTPPSVERPLTDYARVDVAAAKTSIYVGSVSLTMPTFVRAKGVFETTYVAKVFPYFFYNQNGKLNVEFSDEQLRKLERGEVTEFKGQAIAEDGELLRVEGKATPADANSGKLKVRVLVSKRVELIFNTTYRFPDVKPSPAAAAPSP